jgi:hypothetical protein
MRSSLNVDRAPSGRLSVALLLLLLCWTTSAGAGRAIAACGLTWRGTLERERQRRYVGRRGRERQRAKYPAFQGAARRRPRTAERNRSRDQGDTGRAARSRPGSDAHAITHETGGHQLPGSEIAEGRCPPVWVRERSSTGAAALAAAAQPIRARSRRSGARDRADRCLPGLARHTRLRSRDSRRAHQQAHACNQYGRNAPVAGPRSVD